jgi:hypothetical protein
VWTVKNVWYNHKILLVVPIGNEWRAVHKWWRAVSYNLSCSNNYHAVIIIMQCSIRMISFAFQIKAKFRNAWALSSNNIRILVGPICSLFFGVVHWILLYRTKQKRHFNTFVTKIILLHQWNKTHILLQRPVF